MNDRKPGQFPQPYELGLDRLAKDFGLVPVEYPATRKPGSTPRERPQLVIPYGGTVRVDGPARRVTVTY
ncbi:hypothetical protein ACWC0A_04770 [Streptomyces scopuliridis]